MIARLRVKLFLLALVPVLCLGGCMGPAPVEEILRLPLAGCLGCNETHDSPDSRPIIAIKDVTCLPALDRAAVLFAQGNVLSPNTQWYWEGTPAEVVSRSLASCLDCSDRFKAVWPYRPRLKHDAQLHGRILSFEVRLDGENRFELVMDLELWNRRGSEMLLSRTFSAEAPLLGSSASDVAQAADSALAVVVDKATLWLEEEAVGVIGMR